MNSLRQIIRKILNESIILESRMSDREKFYKYFKGIKIKDFKDLKYPKDDSKEVEKEILKIRAIDIDRAFVLKHDKIEKVFKDYFKDHGLDFPSMMVSNVMDGLTYFLMELKDYYARPRPYKLAKELDIDLKFVDLSSSRTLSFPSGHAVQSHVLAYILSDMFPKHKKSFEKMAEDISMSRMMAKVHYPSDIEVGKKIAKDLYKQYKKNNI